MFKKAIRNLLVFFFHFSKNVFENFHVLSDSDVDLVTIERITRLFNHIDVQIYV
jgi:hypothetical protein